MKLNYVKVVLLMLAIFMMPTHIMAIDTDGDGVENILDIRVTESSLAVKPQLIMADRVPFTCEPAIYQSIDKNLNILYSRSI